MSRQNDAPRALSRAELCYTRFCALEIGTQSPAVHTACALADGDAAAEWLPHWRAEAPAPQDFRLV